MSDVAVGRAELTLPAGRRRRRFPILIGLCFVFVAMVIVFAAFGGVIAPQEANAQNLFVGVTPPSGDFWLGTDDLGRDILSRLIVGARTAVVGPILIALGAFVIGNALGLFAGYRGGWSDALIMRWVDVMYAIPPLLIAIVVVGVLGGTLLARVGLLVILTAPYDTRIVRGGDARAASAPLCRSGAHPRAPAMADHVPAHLAEASCLSSSRPRSLNFAFSLVDLAALSFLGLGVGLATPDWGRMLSDGIPLLFDNAAVSVAPAIMIVLTAASMNLIGDWFYERLVRSRARPLMDPAASDGLEQIAGPAKPLLTVRVFASIAVGPAPRHDHRQRCRPHFGTRRTVGIVGESGSGKSLTARALIGLLPVRSLCRRRDRLPRAEHPLDLPERQLARTPRVARSA